MEKGYLCFCNLAFPCLVARNTKGNFFLKRNYVTGAVKFSLHFQE